MEYIVAFIVSLITSIILFKIIYKINTRNNKNQIGIILTYLYLIILVPVLLYYSSAAIIYVLISNLHAMIPGYFITTLFLAALVMLVIVTFAYKYIREHHLMFVGNIKNLKYIDYRFLFILMIVVIVSNVLINTLSMLITYNRQPLDYTVYYILYVIFYTYYGIYLSYSLAKYIQRHKYNNNKYIHNLKK
ncbi:hypothetical protein [Mycoplasma sp. P36-A1]|uniref:hypothetical protein n=1 Tax=Mycoplasma sp. P36-A1 TaxID=3252900 RepID=UPI003C2FD1D1